MALINNFGGSNLFRNLQTGNKNQINKNPQISLNKEPQKLEMGQKIELGQLNGSDKTTQRFRVIGSETGDIQKDVTRQYQLDRAQGQAWKDGDTISYKNKTYVVNITPGKDGADGIKLTEARSPLSK